MLLKAKNLRDCVSILKAAGGHCKSTMKEKRSTLKLTSKESLGPKYVVCGVDLPPPHVTQTSCFDALHARPRNVQNYHLFCEPLYTKPEANKIKEELNLVVEISKRCFEFQFALLRRTMVAVQLQLISTSANRRWLRLAPPFAKVSVCRALSYVQTDATTPNIVASCCVRVGNGVQTDATTPNKVGTCSASWEGYKP